MKAEGQAKEVEKKKKALRRVGEEGEGTQRSTCEK